MHWWWEFSADAVRPHWSAKVFLCKWTSLAALCFPVPPPSALTRQANHWLVTSQREFLQATQRSVQGTLLWTLFTDWWNNYCCVSFTPLPSSFTAPIGVKGWLFTAMTVNSEQSHVTPIIVRAVLFKRFLLRLWSTLRHRGTPSFSFFGLNMVMKMGCGFVWDVVLRWYKAIVNDN